MSRKFLMLHAGVIFLAALLLAASYLLNESLPLELAPSDLEGQVKGAIQGFTASVPSVGKLRLEDFSGFPTDESLVDPAQALPHEYQLPKVELQNIFLYAEKCGIEPANLRHDEALAKLLQWTNYTCGKFPRLHKDFFLKPPYMHPAGRSYAYLYWNMHQGQFDDSLAERDFLSLVHVAELKIIRKKMIMGGANEILSRFTLDELGALYSRSAVVVGDPCVLIGNGDESLIYHSYTSESWHRFFATQTVQPVPKNQMSRGGFRFGNLRWTINRTRLETARQASLWTSALGAALLLAECGFFLFAFVAVKRREWRRRLFNLQMLSHELRTPMTAMKLNLDALQEYYDHLPSSGQIALLRMLQAEGRIAQVLDASRAYIQAGARRLVLNFEVCESIEELLRDLVAHHGDLVSVQPTGHLDAISIDRYWFSFCVSNVVDNAIKHGRPPVTITIIERSGEMGVEVRDQGHLSRRDYAEYRRPFTKKVESPGLGLGISLVEQMLKDMRGRLEFRGELSTTFTLWFKREKV